jgi:hypothetical protein
MEITINGQPVESIDITTDEGGITMRLSRLGLGLGVLPTVSGLINKYIIPIMGQSNAFGFAAQADVVGGYVDYPTGVMQLNQSNAVVQATSTLDHPGINVGKFGFTRRFVERLLAADPTAEILLVPCAEGGTGFGGTYNAGDPSAGGARWVRDVGDRYTTAVARIGTAMAAPDWTDATVPCVLWHQGEIDSGAGPSTYDLTQSQYSAFMRDLIAGVRAATGESTPFLTGDLKEQYRGIGASLKGVTDSYRNHLRLDSGVHHSQHIDINSGDGTHFDYLGAPEIGDLYWQASVHAGIFTDPTAVFTDLVPVSTWGSRITASQSSFTFSPTWAGTATRALITCAYKPSANAPTCTVNGVAATLKSSNVYVLNDGMFIWETDQTSGNVIIDFSGSNASQCHVHTLQFYGTDHVVFRVVDSAGAGARTLPIEASSLLTALYHTGSVSPAAFAWTNTTTTANTSSPRLTLQTGYNVSGGPYTTASTDNAYMFVQAFGFQALL